MLLEVADESCYLGPFLLRVGVVTRKCLQGRRPVTFTRTSNTRKCKRFKMRLYDSLVLKLYVSETWNLTRANLKRLEAARGKAKF